MLLIGSVMQTDHEVTARNFFVAAQEYRGLKLTLLNGKVRIERIA